MATEGSTATLGGRVRLKPMLNLSPCLPDLPRWFRCVATHTESLRYCTSDRQRYMDEFNDLSRKDVFCFLLSTRAGGEHLPAGLTVCVDAFSLGSNLADDTFSSPVGTHLVFDRFGDQPSLG